MQYRKLLIPVFSVCLAACTAELQEALESSAQDMVRSASPLTRSGISAVDGALGEIGVVSLERVYPYAGKNEERTRAAGLHRWYLLKFAPEKNLDEAAAQLAQVPEVLRISPEVRAGEES